MVVAVTPYFQLITSVTGNYWHFVLEDLRGEDRFQVTDSEPGLLGERLQLLALVRGLESLDRSARLRIVTASRYVYEGLTFGLRKWRNDGWRWESFGLLVPIKNVDLWQRVDQALKYHHVESAEFHLRPSFRNKVRLNEQDTPATEPALYHRRSTRAALRIHRLLRMGPTTSREQVHPYVQSVA